VSTDGIRLGDEDYTWDELDKFDTDELESLRDDVETAIADVGAQLNEAKARAHDPSDPQYSDPEWFQRAKTAKARLSIGSQRLSRMLKKRRRTEGRRFCEYFMDAARELLTQDLFTRVFASAEDKEKASTRG
jgi:hypothetical protein